MFCEHGRETGCTAGTRAQLFVAGIHMLVVNFTILVFMYVLFFPSLQWFWESVQIDACTDETLYPVNVSFIITYTLHIY